MSPAELDVPHSSDHIRGMEFGTIRRGGYDPEQVRDYLERVATRVATLELELREARLHAAPQEQVVPDQGPADDPYERFASRFALMQTAPDTASLSRSESPYRALQSLPEASSGFTFRGEANYFPAQNSCRCSPEESCARVSFPARTASRRRR